MQIKYVHPRELKPHPLNLELVPEMAPEEFEALVEDVREKGVLQPLEVLKGTSLILDGRNRWRASIEAELGEIPYREMDIPEEEVPLYILERVPTHRSLPPGVHAALAAEWMEAMKPYAEAARDITKLAGKGIQKKDLYGGAKNGTTIPESSESYGGVKNDTTIKTENPDAYGGGNFSTTIKIGKLREWTAKNTGVALPARILLKRMHHGGENADHSQTHDPRGTQGLPQKTRPYPRRSCKVTGDNQDRPQSLGERQKKNSTLSLRIALLLERERPRLILSTNYGLDVTLSLLVQLQCNR